MTAQKLWLAGVMLLSCLSAWAENVSVAAASNFTAAMNEIITEFEKASGHNVKVSFGSSGKLYAQIKHGAPFDIFFSADQAKPEAFEQEGWVVPGSRFTYAFGALALWSVKPGMVNKNVTILRQGKFNKLALANPRLAPYGAAALETLESLKLKESTRAKWVQGENIAQTYQFVGTGNADLGFVALSQIMHKGHIKTGSAWVIPTKLYNPIRQDAVLLRRGEHSRAALELMEFVRSEKASVLMESYGYQKQTVEH